MKQDIYIEVLADGRYAITKDDYEESQKAWQESVKDAYRLGLTRAAEIAESYGEKMYAGGVYPAPSSYALTILTERDKKED